MHDPHKSLEERHPDVTPAQVRELVSDDAGNVTLRQRRDQPGGQHDPRPKKPHDRRHVDPRTDQQRNRLPPITARGLRYGNDPVAVPYARCASFRRLSKQH